MKKHDEHYAKMKIETIEVMEQRIEPHPEISNQQLQCMSIALKHIIRAGHKDGQPWKKDIEKAINYLTRALTGDWIHIKGEAQLVDLCGTLRQIRYCKRCGAENSIALEETWEGLTCYSCSGLLDNE